MPTSFLIGITSRDLPLQNYVLKSLFFCIQPCIGRTTFFTLFVVPMPRFFVAVSFFLHSFFLRLCYKHFLLCTFSFWPPHTHLSVLCSFCSHDINFLCSLRCTDVDFVMFLQSQNYSPLLFFVLCKCTSFTLKALSFYPAPLSHLSPLKT